MRKPSFVLRNPAPASLPDEAPVLAKAQPPVQEHAKVIAAELPAPHDADTNPDVRISSAVVNADKPKLSKEERREARAALDRKTRKYMMAFGAVVVLAVTVFVASLGGGGGGGDKSPADKPTAAADAPAGTGQKSDLASEADPVQMNKANMLGAYKTTTDVLKDFDRAAKKAQDHSVGF